MEREEKHIKKHIDDLLINGCSTKELIEAFKYGVEINCRAGLYVQTYNTDGTKRGSALQIRTINGNQVNGDTTITSLQDGGFMDSGYRDGTEINYYTVDLALWQKKFSVEVLEEVLEVLFANGVAVDNGQLKDPLVNKVLTNIYMSRLALNRIKKLPLPSNPIKLLISSDVVKYVISDFLPDPKKMHFTVKKAIQDIIIKKKEVKEEETLGAIAEMFKPEPKPEAKKINSCDIL